MHDAQPFASRFTSLLLAVGLLLLAGAALMANAAPASAAVQPQIVGGEGHVCVLTDAGAVKCWGSNTRGVVGNGNAVPQYAPVDVLGLQSGVTQIASSRETNCALITDGTVRCWGANDAGEIASGASDASDHATPVAVGGLAGVTQVAANYNGFCARLSDATVKCWGGNTFGQVGPGAGGNPQPSAVTVTGLTGVAKLSGGLFHACAQMIDASVKCWGRNAKGELGQGTTDALAHPTPVSVPALSGVTQLRGTDATCAQVADSSLRCWGDNSMGQMGIGSYSLFGQSTPVAPSGVAGEFTLAGQHGAMCVLYAAGSLTCWGTNDSKQLGTGNADSVLAPFATPFGSDLRAVIAGPTGATMCFMRRGGGVECLGNNNTGQLGIGVTGAPVAASAAVPGLDLVTEVYPPGSGAVLAVPKKPRADKRKRYIKVKGTLTVTPSPLVSPAEACTGKALVSTKLVTRKRTRKHKAKSKTYKTSPPVAVQGASCQASFTLKLPVKYASGKRIKLQGSFPGNASLAATAAPALKYKLPKIKKKSARR